MGDKMASLENTVRDLTATVKQLRTAWNNRLNVLENNKLGQMRSVQDTTINMFKTRVNWSMMGITPNYSDISQLIKQLRNKGLLKEVVIAPIVKYYEENISIVNRKYREGREREEKEARRQIDRVEEQADKATIAITRA